MSQSNRKSKPVRKSPAAVSPARFEAFTILMEVDRGQSYADDLLRAARVSALSPQDRNLCTTIVLGTLRWQIALDALIKKFLSRPNAKLDPAIRIALRMGAFQLRHLDRIPAHAAIHESVSLAQLSGHQFASGMVNAVLRMISTEPAEGVDAASAHPAWLVERWTAHYGQAAAQAICRNGQQQPELSVRGVDLEMEAELAAQGIELAPGTLLTASRRILSGDVTVSEAFRTGRLRIQEEGSQLIAEVAGRGSQILDACAAPGGKTLVLAERNPAAQITACELSPSRCETLRLRLAVYPGFAANISVLEADASQLPAEPKYDVILADVPCSGTGTLGRNPEIRHRLKLEDLSRQHQRQCSILLSALRAGTGQVLYSTCSLEPEENAAVIAEVLTQSPEWRHVSLKMRIEQLRSEGFLTESGAVLLQSLLAQDGSLTLLPGAFGADGQTDGFYLALLKKMP